MSDLIDTTQMYLRTLYELQEEGVPPLRARIAERLHQSGPTVSQTVARMERDGLLTVEDDRHVTLSPQGRLLAMRVMRKHRLAERMLLDVLGLPWEMVHEEACRWEHVMSDEVERRIVALLESPAESPYGNPIPGLDELGVAGHAAQFRAGNESLLVLVEKQAEPVGVEIVRLGEALQAADGVLVRMRSAGVGAGATVTARMERHMVLLEAGEGRRFEMPAELAAHVFVKPLA